MQAKLALHAKENIELDILLDPKLENVQLPLEPINESAINGSSAQLERDRLARNAQLKNNWENQCQKQMELGIMCGDKQIARQYLCYTSVWAPKEDASYVAETRTSRLKMDILTTVELWEIMEKTYICQPNITFDRYMLLTTKQSKGESIEHFLAKWRNCPRIAILEFKKIPLSETFSLPICKTPKSNENYLEKLSNQHKHYA